MISINSHTINKNSTIRQALEKLTALGENLTLFIIEENEVLLGVITDGDIRRGLIKGFSLDDIISCIMNVDFKFILENEISFDIVKQLKKSSVKIIPVLSEDKKIQRFINLSDLKAILPIDAVIIAGGKGERLMPLTKNTPKPMLNIGLKPILEHNIDFLSQYGITQFHISVNYLKNIIKDYFKNGSNKNIQINYIEENEPLGTIGSVKLSNSYRNSDILIMNSDLLTNLNLVDFYNSFKESNADMAIATTSYNVNVPYAVLDVEDGQVKSFKEKPTYNYFSNAGIYLIKKDLINEIPDNQFYNATDLINKLLKLNRLVISYPILGYWLDVGKHDDYSKAQEDIKHIIF
jgi:dTDP-glucose pyrophosphorylase/CBS domain-containing protein